MPGLREKKPIEWIAVALAQFARDQQWLHLNRQRTQTIGECLISKATRLNRDLALAPLETQLPN